MLPGRLDGSMRPSRVLATLLALMGLYLISIGPIYVLLFRMVFLDSDGDPAHYSVAIHAFTTFYAPIIWLSDHHSGFKAFLEWYVKLCGLPKL